MEVKPLRDYNPNLTAREREIEQMISLTSVVLIKLPRQAKDEVGSLDGLSAMLLGEGTRAYHAPRWCVSSRARIMHSKASAVGERAQVDMQISLAELLST